MRALFTLTAAAGLGVVFMLACGDRATPCSTWQDCQSSDEANALRPCDNDGQGAKIHVNTQCVEGRCRVECAKTCIPAGTCGPGAVCETPPGIAPSSVMRSCMKNPIACNDASECPLETPGEGEWSCTEGFCRFPGFSYAFE